MSVGAPPQLTLLAAALIAALAPRVEAQGAPRYRATVLDVEGAGSREGPAGRFWFPDWPWPADVDREHAWEVDPRTYATRARSAGELVVGEVEALRPGGPRPVRPLVWDRRLRYQSLGAGRELLGVSRGGLRFERAGVDRVEVVDGRRRERLDLRGIEGWSPAASNGEGLVLGTGRRGGEELLTVMEVRRGRVTGMRTMPLRFRPRDVDPSGWVIGSADGAPVVFGPLLRDGRLLPQARLDELAPRIWRGPARAELVAFAGRDIVGHVPGGGGRSAAHLWSLDPRATEVGGESEALPAGEGPARVVAANSAGEVLGRVGGRPVLWQRKARGWQRVDLRRALVAPAGLELVEVAGIDERGAIVGTASLVHPPSGDSYQRAVRLFRRRGVD